MTSLTDQPTGLFDLDDFDETRTVWVMVGDWGRCGFCGVKCSFNQGGSKTGAVCDECAQIDHCQIRPHEPVIERRPSRLLNIDEAAHCLKCAWFLSVADSEDVEYTPEQVAARVAEHARPRHTSHWGMSHEIGDHDRLVAERARRRAKYLAEVTR